MIRVLTLILSIGFSAQVFAATPKKTAGFIPVSKALSLYVTHEPATADKLTIVILNGLTHTTENWKAFLKSFKRNGHGVVQIDLAGQGQTLAKHGAVYNVIRYQEQAVYVSRIIKSLNLKSKVVMLGLSYGGGITTYFASKYPQLVSKIVILAPYTEPQPDQDKWIRDQIAATRIAFPYNPATDDELYDYFLKQLVYTVYPTAEPDLLRIPFKLEAVFRMVQGMRKLHTAKHSATLPAHSVHLVGGGSDQLVSPKILDRFWSSIPEASKASRLTIKNTDHDLIKLEPKVVAQWVQRILANDPQTVGGKVTEVTP